MSLINEALLDLQSHQRSNDFTREKVKVEVLADTPNFRFGTVVFGLLSVVALMYFGLSDFSDTDLPTQVQGEQVFVKNAVHEHPQKQLFEDRATVNAEENIEDNKTLETVDSKAVEIAAMIAKLEIAIARNRLSLPKGDNALFYLSQISALDPSNSQAKLLFQKTKEKFTVQLDAAIAKHDKKRANLLLARAPLFDLEPEYLANAQHLAQSIIVHDNVAKHQKTASPVIQGESVVKKSLAFLDKQKQAEAAALIHRGRSRDAENLLENFIVEHPLAKRTPLQLFNLYMDHGKLKKAELFVAGLVKKHPAERYFRARIANHYYGEAQAIGLLENYSPNEDVAHIYQSFLAGLYQQEKQYNKAQDLYKALLQLQPDNGQFLLGFGLSSDALKEYHHARWAFEKINRIGHSNPKVLDYVQKRLADLAGQQLVENQLW